MKKSLKTINTVDRYSSMEKKSFLHNGGGWITNIGNAFLDYGSMQSLREAYPNGEIHLTSVMNRWISHHINRKIPEIFKRKKSDISNVFNLQFAANIDYIVQSGAFLASHWFELHGELLLKYKAKGGKIIFNGAGMTDPTYNDDEIALTRKWIKKISPDIFISRDETTYNHFHDLAEHSYNGIDVAFFLNRSYSPMKLDFLPYFTLNFDKSKEIPLNLLMINENDLIIRTHHSFWHNFSFIEYYKMKNEYYGKKNTIISEIPEDYLNVYANTRTTFSDRVHACIATLSYGNQARLYSKTPRAKLFQKVGAKDITSTIVTPNLIKIEQEKTNQVKFLSETII